ncbi:MAG: hypothetical protein AAGD00_10525 [Planctomycetota bacterium]
MPDRDPILESLLMEQSRMRASRARRRRAAGVLCVALLPMLVLALALRAPSRVPTAHTAEIPDAPAASVRTPRIEVVSTASVPNDWIVRAAAAPSIERIDDGALNALLAGAGAPTGIVRTDKRTTLVALLTRDRVAATRDPTQTN